MRLYDKIAAFGPDGFTHFTQGSVAWPEGLYDAIVSAVRIDAQNVSDYIYSTPTTLRGVDLANDLPSLAGPFTSFWVEWSPPQNLRHPDTGEALIPRGAFRRLGVQFIAVNPNEMGMSNDQGAERSTVGWMFADDPQGVRGPLLYTRIDTGSQGELLGQVQIKSTTPKTTHNEAASALGGFLAVSFMAIGFMHCKNVAIEDAPDMRTRQQRRHDERKGIEHTTFKVLAIEPMKKVLKSEGGIDRNGLKRALHVCRGHFATYTEERPRFGRKADGVGKFWIQPHVRGSAESGMVGKDYAVKAPK